MSMIAWLELRKYHKILIDDRKVKETKKEHGGLKIGVDLNFWLITNCLITASV